jgi:hypothetical protein
MEYKIQWTKVFVKYMQSDTTIGYRKEYIIKNWKIDAEQLKNYYLSWHHKESEKEFIEWFKKLCDRHLLHDIRISTFVLVVEEWLKNDFQKMNKNEFNTMIDSKIKDLNQWKKELENLCEELWLSKDDKNWDNLNKSEKIWKWKEYNEWVDKICEKYWCSWWQLVHDTEQTIKELNSYKL